MFMSLKEVFVGIKTWNKDCVEVPILYENNIDHNTWKAWFASLGSMWSFCNVF